MERSSLYDSCRFEGKTEEYVFDIGLLRKGRSVWWQEVSCRDCCPGCAEYLGRDSGTNSGTYRPDDALCGSAVSWQGGFASDGEVT